MSDIRIVTSETIGVFSDILREAADWMISQGFENWNPSSFTAENILKDSEFDELYICYIGDEPAGCFRVQDTDDMFWPEKPSGEALYVHKLAVKRVFAGQGVSKAILDWVKNYALVKGLPFVRLDCIANRKKLCKVYKMQGFRKVDEKQVFGYSPSARFEYVVNV